MMRSPLFYQISRRIFRLLVIVSLSGLPVHAQEDALSSDDQPVVFSGVHVITMLSDKVLRNQDVVVSKGRITAMGPSGSIMYIMTARVIPAKGKYLMPGLAEMHAHVPPVEDLAPMKEVLTLFLSQGVTTIRGMLGHPKHLELRSLIREGRILGPRFYTSGPSLNGNSVKTVTQAEEMVRAQRSAGYDFLKLHPGLTRENFDAIAKIAGELGIPFAGHVSWQVGVHRAVEARYATIDHLDGMLESLIPGVKDMQESEVGIFGLFAGHQADLDKAGPLLRQIKKNKVWLVPTQCLAEKWFSPDVKPEEAIQAPGMQYLDANMKQSWINSTRNLQSNPLYKPEQARTFIQLRRDLIKACQREGVGILLGSDAPQVFNVPGYSTHDELAYYVEAGLTPFQALQTGTVNVGRFYGDPSIGVIRTDAVADLILLDQNPLENIHHTRNISGVMLRGTWLSRSYLDQLLQALRK